LAPRAEEVLLVAVEVEAHKNDAGFEVVEGPQHDRDHDCNAHVVHEDVVMAAAAIVDLRREDHMTFLLVVVAVEGMRLVEDLAEVVGTRRQSTYRVQTYLAAVEDLLVSDTRRRDWEDDP
jgi:hypothetical protein